MSNKTIAIVDINNDQNQNIESLLMAFILEKKCEKLTVIDLNLYNKQNAFFRYDGLKEKDEILTTKLFDRSNYIFATNQALTCLKMNDLAQSLVEKNDILLINTSQTKFEDNQFFYNLANAFVVFADIKKDIITNLTKLFMSSKINNKKIYIYAYNYDDNIQDKKKYLSLIHRFKSDKILVNTVKNVAEFDSINKIENIEPWQDIYKKINGSF